MALVPIPRPGRQNVVYCCAPKRSEVNNSSLVRQSLRNADSLHFTLTLTRIVTPILFWLSQWSSGVMSWIPSNVGNTATLITCGLSKGSDQNPCTETYPSRRSLKPMRSWYLKLLLSESGIELASGSKVHLPA